MVQQDYYYDAMFGLTWSTARVEYMGILLSFD